MSSRCGSVGLTCASGSWADFLLPGVEAGGLRLSRVHSRWPCGVCKRSKVRAADHPGHKEHPSACFASSTYLHWPPGVRQTLLPWASLFSVGRGSGDAPHFLQWPQGPPATREPPPGCAVHSQRAHLEDNPRRHLFQTWTHRACPQPCAICYIYVPEITLATFLRQMTASSGRSTRMVTAVHKGAAN